MSGAILRFLRGGEDFWTDIVNKIRLESIKYLFIVTNSSIKKQGTLKELAVADAIRGRGDFIVPLKFEDVDFAIFPPEIIRKYAIDFSHGWDAGLFELAEKLDRDRIPRTEDNQDVLPFWYQASGIKCTKPTDESEKYLSNWFEIKSPNNIYIHELEPFHRLNLDNFPFSHILEGNKIISFACAECIKEYLFISSSRTVDVNNFIIDNNNSSNDTQSRGNSLAANRKVVLLLDAVFEQFLLSKSLQTYELAGRRSAFYFPSEYKKNISLQKYGRKSRVLYGRSKEFNWHFAIEATCFTYPILAYFITHHIIFTKEGLPMPSPGIQHAKRRALAKGWFNKKWRDLLLAGILSLAENSGDFLEIPLCKHHSLKVSTYPMDFYSPVGYLEPTETEDDQGDDE